MWEEKEPFTPNTFVNWWRYDRNIWILQYFYLFVIDPWSTIYLLWYNLEYIGNGKSWNVKSLHNYIPCVTLIWIISPIDIAHNDIFISFYINKHVFIYSVYWLKSSLFIPLLQEKITTTKFHSLQALKKSSPT